MYNRTLKRMREKIRTSQYIMTLHAEEEMNDDELSIFDIENCIFTGEIVARQKDKDTEEWKYVIEGHTMAGGSVAIITKLGLTGKLIIITVFIK